MPVWHARNIFVQECVILDKTPGVFIKYLLFCWENETQLPLSILVKYLRRRHTLPEGSWDTVIEALWQAITKAIDTSLEERSWGVLIS